MLQFFIMSWKCSRQGRRNICNKLFLTHQELSMRPRAERVCTLLSECHPASMLLLSVCLWLTLHIHVMYSGWSKGHKIHKKNILKKQAGNTNLNCSHITTSSSSSAPARMHLIHNAPTVCLHCLAVRMRGGKKKHTHTHSVWALDGCIIQYGWEWQTVGTAQIKVMSVFLMPRWLTQVDRLKAICRSGRSKELSASISAALPACGGYVGKPLSLSVYHSDITNTGPCKGTAYASHVGASYRTHRQTHVHFLATLLGTPC